MDNEHINEVIVELFNLNMDYNDILGALAWRYGIIISLSTLKRRLRNFGLGRRKNYSSLLDAALHIEDEISKGNASKGYRWRHVELQQSGICIRRDDVAILHQLLDAEGVEQRQRHRLQRRVYSNSGPNFLWHMDGYDKLKPYGLCIHGCIDGFSRKIIWLQVFRNSSDPRIIAGYYMEQIIELGALPKRIRADMGTENAGVALIQTILNENNHGGTTFLYGTSPHNQRIESWWSILRKEAATEWMDFMAALKDGGYFTGTYIDTSIVQYVFMPILNEELKVLVGVWNNHRIRRSRNAVTPCGKPNVLYNVPEIFDRVDYRVEFDPDMANVALDEYVSLHNESENCETEIKDVLDILMEDNGWHMAADRFEGATLYLNLREALNMDL